MNVNRDAVNELISQFAKENKVNKTKLASLVYNSIAQVQLVSSGRKVNETSEKIRDYIKGLGSGSNFTVRDVTSNLNVSTSIANSNIRALKKMGIVQTDGRKAASVGRGNPSIQWSVI